MHAAQHATRWGAIASLLAATATATLATTGSAHADAAIRVRYLCKGARDATEVTALFFNDRPSAVVLLTGSAGAMRLPQGPSASGARYSQGDAVFWIKGDQATWERGNARPLQCTVSSGSRAPTR